MKKTVLTLLVVGLLLIGVNAFAADGDLIVMGKLGVGTDTPRANALLDAQGSFSDDDWNTTVLNAEGTQTNRGALWGITAKVNAKPSAAKSYTSYRGSSNLVYYSPPSGTLLFTNASPLTGTYSQIQFETGGGTHTFNNAVALSGNFSTRDNNKGTVNITNAIAVNAGGINSQNTGGGPTNITNFRGVNVANPGFEAHSKVSITNLYGLYLNKQTAGTNNYGLVLAGDGAGADIVFGPNKDSSIYSNAGELFAKDSAGNVTQISPHDPETGEWIYYSKNLKTGKVVRVDMERLVRDMEKLTGKKYMVETIEEIE